MGPFFLTPTPKSDNPPSLGEKSIPVAESIMAALQQLAAMKTRHDSRINTSLLIDIMVFYSVLFG